MDCIQAHDAIEDFREGNLPADQETQLTHHLEICRPCRGALSRLDAIDRQLRAGMQTLSPSADFGARVMSAVESAEERGRKSLRLIWIGPCAAVAACLAIAIINRLPVSSDTSLPATAVSARPNRAVAVEPNPDMPFAIGEAYVITDKGIRTFNGSATIHIRRVVRGAPELIVDAFPQTKKGGLL